MSFTSLLQDSVVSRNFADYPPLLSSLFNEALKGNQDACFDLLPLGIEERLFPDMPRYVPQDFPGTIPRHIVQFWDSPVPPGDVRTAMESIRRDNPGFTYYLECDETARAFIHAHYGAEITALYDVCPHPAMRSDFWRLCYLHVKGGVYIDADVISRAPLTDITIGASFKTLLSYSIGQPWCLDNDVLICEAGNPLMQHIMETMFQRVRHILETGYFENIWVSTGPGAMVVGTMSWIARMLKEQHIPFDMIHTALSDAGLAFIHHHQVEQVLDTCSRFAYQGTWANWRSLLQWPSHQVG